MTSSTDTPPQEEPTPALPDNNVMIMKMIVVFLGVLLFVAMITFFILLFTVGIKGDEEEPEVQTPEMNVMLNAGEVVSHMAFSGRDLALHIEGEDRQRIVIVNPYTTDHKAVIYLRADPE